MSNTNCQGESIEAQVQEKEVSMDPSIGELIYLGCVYIYVYIYIYRAQ